MKVSQFFSRAVKVNNRFATAFSRLSSAQAGVASLTYGYGNCRHMNTNAHSVATPSLTKPYSFSTSSNSTHLLVSHNTQLTSNSVQFKKFRGINLSNSQDIVLTSKRHHSTCSRYTRLAENMCGSTVYVYIYLFLIKASIGSIVLLTLHKLNYVFFFFFFL